MKDKPHYDLFELGISLIRQGLYQEGVNTLTDFLDYYPNHKEAHNEKGYALEQMKFFDHALVCYERALEIDADFVPAWVNIGNLLAKRNLMEEALRAYHRALRIDPKSRYALTSKFQVLFKLHRYDEALEVLEQAIQVDPENSQLWYYRGFLLSNKMPTQFDDHDEALESFTKGLEFNPKQAKIWYYKSLFYAGLRDKVNMLETLQKAIELDENFRYEAQTDEAFENYAEDPDFLALVNPVSSPAIVSQS